MQPVRTGLFYQWMSTPSLQKVVQAFPQPEHNLYFVGGCVRDSLLGRSVHDIDLASPLSPDHVAFHLEQAGIPFLEIGRDFGTIMALTDGTSYEITSFRKDIETDGRWAKVCYTDNLMEDAARRDFTINALYLTPTGQLYDPWSGLDDLAIGRLAFIGEPRARIQEDYLRILRFFRFYAWFGRAYPDLATLEACRSLARFLQHISAERIRSEFIKLLSAPTPLVALQLMHQTKIVESFMGISLNLQGFARLQHIESTLGIQAPPLFRLKILLAEHARVLKSRFAFSNRDKAYLDALDLFPTLHHQSLQQWLYEYGTEIAQAFILMKGLTHDLTYDTFPDLQHQWQQTLHWQKPIFPLKGEDALRLGLTGPKVGRALKAVEQWWIQKAFQPSRAECLQQLNNFKETP
jgi:poly(A) polymerase